MKIRTILSATVLLAAPLGAQEKSPDLKDTKDKVSYSIGLNIGFNFRKQNIDLNPEALKAGVVDALAGKPKLDESQVRETMTTFTKEISEKQKQAGEKNKVEADKFLADNKTKAGIKTTASGLEYKMVKDGTGPQPGPTDTVTVNYRGTLIDGTEFDSSYKRNEPATFPLNNVIKGWSEALQLMKKGSKYQIFLPPNLAYGERGMPPDIGPNAALIFEVELMDIKSGASAPPPGASPSGSVK